MRRLALVIAMVVAVGMAVSEAAMQPTPRDRVVLLAVFIGAGLFTLLIHWAGLRRAAHFRRLASQVQMVAVLAVMAAAVTVVLAAGSMFISEHDRNLVLVALGLGIGLSLAAALAVSDRLTSDLALVAEAAGRVAGGELSARAGVERADELGALARSFDEMATRLEATEEERSVLFQSIGHDLRTPLAAIQAAVEALQDGIAPDPAAYLAGISKDIEHLSQLVEDVFTLAKLESGAFQPNPEPVDLTELADDAVEALTPLASVRRVSLRVSSDQRVGAVVDPNGFSRVIRNLLDNAIRFAPEGSVVTVEVVPGSVTVIDQGGGFPADFRERAFERFSRADASRSGGGAGLGLAIAKGIVEASGGRIEIGDGPGGRVRVAL